MQIKFKKITLILVPFFYVSSTNAQHLDQLMNNARTDYKSSGISSYQFGQFVNPSKTSTDNSKIATNVLPGLNVPCDNEKLFNNSSPNRHNAFYPIPFIQSAPDKARYYIQYCQGNVCQMGERPPVKDSSGKPIINKDGGKVDISEYVKPIPPIVINEVGGTPTHGNLPTGGGLLPSPNPPQTGGGLIAPPNSPPLGGGLTSPTPYNPTNTTNHLYVSVTGNDSNPGTKDQPFKTITKASRMAKHSTTVHVGQGIYRENVNTTSSGTSNGRIIYLSEIKWGAQIIGNGINSTWDNKGNYVDIVGFDVSGTGRIGIANNGSNTLIQGNHVHDMKVSGGCNGGGGAGIVNANYSASNGDIIGNVVHDIGTPGACLGVQGIYHSIKGGKIQNNIVYRASAFGIHLWHAATDVLISNNTLVANGSTNMGGGIVFGVGDSPGGVILNNTIVANNIVANNPASGIAQYCYAGQNCIGPNNVVSNNLVYGSRTNIKMKVGRDIGTIVEDPQFVGVGTNGILNDYRLKPTSPAVNKGLAQHAPNNDFDNKARIQTPIDLGAYESY